MAKKRKPRVRIEETPLIRAIGTHYRVLGYMDQLGVGLAYAMERGQRNVSKRVRNETNHEIVHVGKQLRPVVIAKAGFDTGEGRERPGFFSVFLELGTKYMPRKMYMRQAARAFMKSQGLRVYRYKSYPKVKGAVEWRR